MQKNNLAAVSVINRIMERHNTSMRGGPLVDRPGPDQVIYVYTGFNMRFIGRFCAVSGERSGGYVLKAALNERYDHECWPIKWQETRFKAGFTHKQLQRAAHRIMTTLHEERTIKRHREHVYKIAESRNIDLDKVYAIAEAENHTIVYSDMTMADCEFWKVELAKFPLKMGETA